VQAALGMLTLDLAGIDNALTVLARQKAKVEG
jgi:hypothetical protein